MKRSPLISVVIPAFNQAQFIDECLDSVAAQTISESLEIIVVDDGSPDDISRRARQHPVSPTVIRQQNTGVAGARNRGIAESSAPWIAFLDADDRWTPTKLEDQLNALAPLNRPALAFSRYRRTGPDGPVPHAPDHPSPFLKPRARKLLRQNFIGTSTVLVHRRCLERCGGFPETTALNAGGQDYALWLRIAAYFPLVYLPKIAMLYRVHPNNRVGVDSRRHHQDGLQALRDFHDWDPHRFGGLCPLPLALLSSLRSARFLSRSL